MAENTEIQWADMTFNPWSGCTKVSPACEHCYAETMSKRNQGVLGVWGKYGTRVIASDSMWKQPLKWNLQAGAEGVRKRVFCASLADKGHEPLNPMKLVDQAGDRAYEEYLLDALEIVLCSAQAMYMLDGWRSSLGARIEHAIAVEKKLPIFYAASELWD